MLREAEDIDEERDENFAEPQSLGGASGSLSINGANRLGSNR